MEEIGQLIIHFERDIKDKQYPFLGHICLMGIIYPLLDGYNCKQIVDYSPAHANPMGTIMMENIINGDGNACEKFENFLNSEIKPVWFPASEMWKTAQSIHTSLVENAVKVGVADIIGALSEEVDDYINILEQAAADDIRVYLNMDECTNPPDSLVTWSERERNDSAMRMREAFEASGIDIDEAQI